MNSGQIARVQNYGKMEENTLENLFLESKKIPDFSIISPIHSDSNFPNCYNYYNSALSIPLFYDLTDKQQSYVIDQVKKLIG